MNKTHFYLPLILIPLIFFSCNNEDETDELFDDTSDTLIEKIDFPKQLQLDSGEVKMFTMPTPLQIASALKLMEVDYNDQLLLKNGNIAASTDIELSMLLGMYMTDLGYTTVYNNTQKSLRYAKDIQNIMDELPIAFYVNDGFRRRFKESIDNQDSLCSLVLQGYNEANQYMSETGNEGLGLLILSGSYIEGLFLATSSNTNIKWAAEKNNMLIQQKLFLDNFILLLDGYTSNARINTVVIKFKKLKTAFDSIKIEYNDQTESYQLIKSISEKDRLKINSIVTDIRNNISIK